MIVVTTYIALNSNACDNEFCKQTALMPDRPSSGDFIYDSLNAPAIITTASGISATVTGQ